MTAVMAAVSKASCHESAQAREEPAGMAGMSNTRSVKQNPYKLAIRVFLATAASPTPAPAMPHDQGRASGPSELPIRPRCHNKNPTRSNQATVPAKIRRNPCRWVGTMTATTSTGIRTTITVYQTWAGPPVSCSRSGSANATNSSENTPMERANTNSVICTVLGSRTLFGCGTGKSSP